MLYGICNTDGDAQDKKVFCKDFELYDNATISIFFTETCIVDYLTLNIQYTGRKELRYKGRKVQAGIILGNHVYTCLYNGRYYTLLDNNVSLVPLEYSRKITRHPNDCGSVIEYTRFGKKESLFVADAVYRKAFRWETNLELPNVINCPYMFLNGTEECLTSRKISETKLMKTLSCFSKEKSARDNCTRWLRSGEPSVLYTRSLTFPEIGNCDVPTLYQLAVIYLESPVLDALDPTSRFFPEYRLTEWNLQSSGNGAFSCSEGKDAMWVVLSNGFICDSSDELTYGIIPVKELSRRR